MKLLSRLAGAVAFAAISAAAAPVFADGGTLVIGTTLTPRHLNGAVQSGAATLIPSSQLFASPVRYDENWEPQPYLAESWEIAEDGMSVTLNLVDNATFHDGKPITSEDVAFSIMTIKANHPFKTMFAPVDRVETPNAHTAVIKLSEPHPALMLALSPALAPIIPKHIYGDGQDAKSHPANTAVVGSGPFVLEEFRSGEAVVMKKNPDFFIEGRPKLDELIFRTIKDRSSLLIAMENGDTDMYPFMGAPGAIERMEKAENIGVTKDGYAAVGPLNWLAFNTKSPKLSDVRVRHAIAYATDREFITKVLHRGFSDPQRGPIHESSPFFEPDVATYDLDLDKAKALMAEAGYGDGMELSVAYMPGSYEQQQTIAEYLKSQLKKIGIKVSVRTAPDFPTWAQWISNHDFELTMDNVFNWGDPVIGVHRTYVSSNIRKGVIWSNTQQYANPRVDEVLAAAAVEADLEKRKALYSEFQKLVAEDLPIYWINSVPYHTAFDEKLENVPSGIWGLMHPMDNVSWSE